MKNKKIEYLLISVIPAAAILAFWSIDRAIKIPDTSVWVLPIALFSFFATSLLLANIFITKSLEIELISSVAIFFSFLFVLKFWHFLFVIAGIFMILSGLRDMRKDLDLNIKISLWKSLYAGKFKIIFAFAFVISSQYYFTIKNMEGNIKIPKFDISQTTNFFAKPIFATLNPGFKSILEENLTVDEYILQNQNLSSLENINLLQDNDSLELPDNLSESQKELIKKEALSQRKNAQVELSQKNQKLILQEGRAQLEKMFGGKINGNEKMSDIIVSPVANIVNKYFQLNVKEERDSSIFPLVLSVVLFFTLWPLGSLLSILWFLLVILIFKLFIAFDFIKIERIMVERERIV